MEEERLVGPAVGPAVGLTWVVEPMWAAGLVPAVEPWLAAGAAPVAGLAPGVGP